MNKNKTFRVSRSVSIPVNQTQVKHPEFIPKVIAFEDNKKILEKCAILIQKNIPILMIGETGTGKTSVVRHLASKTNNGFVRVNHNGGTTIEDLVGRWLINSSGQTEWVDGVLIQAMKEGYWYLADEINAAGAEINFVYHSLLDDDGRVVLAEKGNEVVIPHDNFRFFGAMNPPGDYAGTKELNKALLSRFAVLKVEYPDPAIEMSILVNRTGVEKNVAELMVKFATQIRIGHASEQYRCIMSTRDLIMWASLYTTYNKYITSAESSILNKVNEEDFEAIKDVLSLHFKAIDDGTVTTAQTAEPVYTASSTVDPF
jgi:cobaltochelatase CobS